MTKGIDAEIRKARELFEKAFQADRISKRIQRINKELKWFKESENKEINDT